MLPDFTLAYDDAYSWYILKWHEKLGAYITFEKGMDQGTAERRVNELLRAIVVLEQKEH